MRHNLESSNDENSDSWHYKRFYMDACVHSIHIFATTGSPAQFNELSCQTILTQFIKNIYTCKFLFIEGCILSNFREINGFEMKDAHVLVQRTRSSCAKCTLLQRVCTEFRLFVCVCYCFAKNCFFDCNMFRLTE